MERGGRPERDQRWSLSSSREPGEERNERGTVAEEGNKRRETQVRQDQSASNNAEREKEGGSNQQPQCNPRRDHCSCAAARDGGGLSQASLCAPVCGLRLCAARVLSLCACDLSLAISSSFRIRCCSRQSTVICILMLRPLPLAKRSAEHSRVPAAQQRAAAAELRARGTVGRRERWRMGAYDAVQRRDAAERCSEQRTSAGVVSKRSKMGMQRGGGDGTEARRVLRGLRTCNPV